ncbi:MAG: DUF559 domain-containing protein [Actinomycetota bacterium]|nr:DUF559 domain-containing protein [Actinomycetota bacterium]
MIDPTELRSGRSRWAATVASIASRQYGAVTRAQLRGIGLSDRTIDHWVARGRLHTVYPGVYMVGHRAMPALARELAAVLACGPYAFLSHRSAIELWRMLPRRDGLALQVTTRNRRIQGPGSLRLHVSETLSDRYVGRHLRIPVTAPTRAIIEFASQGTEFELGRAYEEGLIKGLFTRRKMIATLMDHRGHRGVRSVRALVDRDEPPCVTIEVAHRMLLELIRRSSLPHPRTEAKVGPYRADILFASEKVVVEMDGAAFHSTGGKREADTARDAEMVARGYVVLRITWHQLTKRPGEVIDRIARALAARSAPAHPPSRSA